MIADSVYEGDALCELIRVVVDFVPVISGVPSLRGGAEPGLVPQRRVVLIGHDRTLDVVARPRAAGAVVPVVAIDRAANVSQPTLWFLHQPIDAKGAAVGPLLASPADSVVSCLGWRDRLRTLVRVRSLFREAREPDGSWSRVAMPSVIRSAERH